MNLREYLFKKRITQIDFAKRLGISRGHLGQILHSRMLKGFKKIKKLHVQVEKLQAIQGKSSKKKVVEKL